MNSNKVLQATWVGAGVLLMQYMSPGVERHIEWWWWRENLPKTRSYAIQAKGMATTKLG